MNNKNEDNQINIKEPIMVQRILYSLVLTIALTVVILSDSRFYIIKNIISLKFSSIFYFEELFLLFISLGLSVYSIRNTKIYERATINWGFILIALVVLFYPTYWGLTFLFALADSLIAIFLMLWISELKIPFMALLFIGLTKIFISHNQETTDNKSSLNIFYKIGILFAVACLLRVVFFETIRNIITSIDSDSLEHMLYSLLTPFYFIVSYLFILWLKIYERVTFNRWLNMFIAIGLVFWTMYFFHGFRYINSLHVIHILSHVIDAFLILSFFQVCSTLQPIIKQP